MRPIRALCGVLLVGGSLTLALPAAEPRPAEARAASAEEQPPAEPPVKGKPILERLFGPDEPKPAPKPVGPAPLPAPPKNFLSEQKVFLERLKSLDKLRQVAVENNDKALGDKVDQLEQELNETFEKRIAALPPAKPAESKPSPSTKRGMRP